MSPYEEKRWAELQEYWQRKAKRRALLPPKAQAVASAGGQKIVSAGRRSGRAIAAATPDSVADLAESAVDAAFVPVLKGAVHLLELVTEWSAELTDPEQVLDHHRKHGRPVRCLPDLQLLDLEHLDGLTRPMSRRWRTLGAVEGAALGSLALVPYAGGAAAITADLLVMHVLTTSIATRVAHAYGFDASLPENRQMIDRMVNRSYREQAPKAAAMWDVNAAFAAGRGRQRWSEKLRNDHRLMAALEKLMKQFGGGKAVSVQNVVKALPVVAILAGAGTNSHVLADTAQQATAYAQTVLLSEKYGLPLPEQLQRERETPDE